MAASQSAVFRYCKRCTEINKSKRNIEATSATVGSFAQFEKEKPRKPRFNPAKFSPIPPLKPIPDFETLPRYEPSPPQSGNTTPNVASAGSTPSSTHAYSYPPPPPAPTAAAPATKGKPRVPRAKVPPLPPPSVTSRAEKAEKQRLLFEQSRARMSARQKLGIDSNPTGSAAGAAGTPTPPSCHTPCSTASSPRDDVFPSFFRDETSEQPYRFQERMACAAHMKAFQSKPWKVLCLSSTLLTNTANTNAVIKKTIGKHYRLLALLIHPDKVGLALLNATDRSAEDHDKLLSLSNEAFKILTEAYNKLLKGL